MARVLLVAKNFHLTAAQLAESLQSQQHEVLVVTSKEHLSQIPNILYTFEKWSLKEALVFFPFLLNFNPHVVHLILDGVQMSPAQSAIALWPKLLPHCVLATTLLSTTQGLEGTRLLRYFVEQSDVVTCPNIESLGDLRGLNVRPLKQGRSLLAPVLDPKKIRSAKRQAQNQEEIIPNSPPPGWSYFSDYFVLPFHESSFQKSLPFFRRLHILATESPLVLWGSYDHWPIFERKLFVDWLKRNGLENRWTLTGDLSEIQIHNFLSRAQSLILAGQDLDPHEFVTYVQYTMASKCPLVLDSQQAQLHPQIWKNGENCWIWDKQHFNTDMQAWIQLKDRKLPVMLGDFLNLERQILDSPFNEFNRLLSRALGSPVH